MLRTRKLIVVAFFWTLILCTVEVFVQDFQKSRPGEENQEQLDFALMPRIIEARL